MRHRACVKHNDSGNRCGYFVASRCNYLELKEADVRYAKQIVGETVLR